MRISVQEVHLLGPGTPFSPDPGEGWGRESSVYMPRQSSWGPLGTRCSVGERGREEGILSVWKGRERMAINLWWISEEGCPRDLRDEVVHCSSQKVIIALLIASLPGGDIVTALGLQTPSHSRVDDVPT